MPMLSVGQFGLNAPPKARGYQQMPATVNQVARSGVSDAKWPEKTIAVKDLQATQATVKDSKVRNYTKMGQKSDAPPVSVVEHEGTNYLLNGHHRTAAVIAAGADDVRARVFSTSNPAHMKAMQQNAAIHDAVTHARDEQMDNLRATHEHAGTVGSPEHWESRRSINNAAIDSHSAADRAAGIMMHVPRYSV